MESGEKKLYAYNKMAGALQEAAAPPRPRTRVSASANRVAPAPVMGTQAVIPDMLRMQSMSNVGGDDDEQAQQAQQVQQVQQAQARSPGTGTTLPCR